MRLPEFMRRLFPKAWVRSARLRSRRVRAIARLLREVLVPPPLAIGAKEKLRACCGALFGIFVTSLLTALLFPGESRDIAWLVAPMGASAVLLFATPASPLAQPWSVLGGNLISALVGVTCAHWFTLPFLASAVAVSLALAAMLLLRCLHPPGGAVALTAVLGGPAVQAAGYELLWFPIGINSALLLVLAVFFHNATRHRYPHRLPHATVAQPVTPLLRITRADLLQALADSDEILDIDIDDLEEVTRRAENHALSRLATREPSRSSNRRSPRTRFKTNLR